MTEINETIGPRALLAADTDRTQAYVFESARLPEIRGASNLLRELNEGEAPALIERLDPTARRIYAGGGGLLYEVDADQAEQIKQALEALYPNKTGVATISCVYRKLPKNGAGEGLPQIAPDPGRIAQLSSEQRARWNNVYRDLGCFGAWVRLLGEDLRRHKQEKLHVPFIETPAYAHRCESCQTRPAEDVLPHYEDTLALCRECRKKKEASERFPWRDDFDEKLRTWYPELAQQYFSLAPKGQIPLDIEIIAQACRPQNHNKRSYVAFIYADGDGVGAFVESRRTRKHYKDVSNQLREATWRAVTFGLASNLALVPLRNPLVKQPQDTEMSLTPTQPFEIITVGGDDVMLIVPAHAALDIAQDMASEFRRFLDSKGVNEDLQRPLTLSAGVVIAPTHMPVRLMRDFALELLKKSAKPRARKEKEAVVDFQVFTSTALYGTGVMDARRLAPYTVVPPDQEKDDKPLFLTCRPYTLTELKRLREALDKMQASGFSTSQIHQLASALEQGRWRSTLFYLYQRSRLDKEHRQALEEVEGILPRGSEDTVPWYKAASDSPYTYRTTLRDIAELYDFLPDTEEVF